jgi:PAS domain S-box-containing protein
MPTIALEIGESNEESIRWIETISMPIVILDNVRKVVGWNRMAAESTLIPRQDIIHQLLSHFLHGNSVERLKIAVREIESGGSDNNICNLSFSKNDGRQFRVKLAAQQEPTSGEGLRIVCFFMYHIDRKVPPSAPSSPLPSAKTYAPNLTIQDNRNHSSNDDVDSAIELRQLIDKANLPIFGVDKAGVVNEWNSMMAEVTGYSKEEALQKALAETFIIPSLQTSVQEVLENALQGRGTFNLKVEIQAKNNDFRSFLLNATTRRNIENRIVGVVLFAQDVTEVYKQDRAVESVAKELRKLIDTANAPIFGIDCDGNVNEWNGKTAEIVGFTKEDAFGCSLVERFIVPSMRLSVQAVLDNALQGRGTSNYELEFQTSSNEIRHLLVNATTRRDAENKVVGVVGVAQDVTEAVHRDRAVAGMAAELRHLIDTATAPIFGIDIDGNVNEWNGRTADITGYSKEEAFDEPLIEKFIADSMKDRVQEILAKALEGNETSNYELEFISKAGEPIFLLVNATTRRDPENTVVGGKINLL